MKVACIPHPIDHSIPLLSVLGRSVRFQGCSLAAVTESRSKSIRKAVVLLDSKLKSHDLTKLFHATFSRRGIAANGETIDQSISIRMAWNIVTIWLLAQASGDVSENCDLVTAEKWFRGNVKIPVPLLTSSLDHVTLKIAHTLLKETALEKSFWELLPYILEEHGPGSRASVMRDPTTAEARAAKRKHGVFYTPADVADYMVKHTFENFEGEVNHTKCLDPACGTGVFLSALCRFVRNQCIGHSFNCLKFIQDSVYGSDRNPQALDGAAFVLLLECLRTEGCLKISPWSAWHLIRLNLIEIDAIRLRLPNSKSPESALKKHAFVKIELSANQWIEPFDQTPFSQRQFSRSEDDLFEDFGVPINRVFPDVLKGFDILIGNPPYASIGPRLDMPSLSMNYACLRRRKNNESSDCFPLFIEMMWRLTTPGKNASALVTPLSIAFNRGSQMEDCRHEMSKKGGKWQFAFFDREPHALFGEEVKTRNAILFRSEDRCFPERGHRALIETGPLRKWTSRTRQQLFDKIDFTPLHDLHISAGIPKLQSASQSDVLSRLKIIQNRLPEWCARISKCKPLEALMDARDGKIFVGGTAYNFLNVYRGFQCERVIPKIVSESPIHFLEFESESEARAVFAILSSRFTFWLWHVLGDGFHVAQWLFEEIPFTKASFTANQLKDLSLLGENLWRRIQEHRIESVNGGKLTFAFRPLACNEERDQIDRILVQSLGLAEDFCSDLRDFVHRIVVVDPKDKRRKHLLEYFETT